MGFFCTPLIDGSTSTCLLGKLRQMRRLCWLSISQRVVINSAVPRREADTGWQRQTLSDLRVLKQKFSPQTSGTSLNRAACTYNHNEPCSVLLSAKAPGDTLMRWNSKTKSGFEICMTTAEASFHINSAQQCCLLCSQDTDWLVNIWPLLKIDLEEFAPKLPGSLISQFNLSSFYFKLLF